MDAYSSVAAGYDTLTADYDYDRWLAAIEALARDAGLRGDRLLDVACGTGSSFMPLRDRYAVVGCDLSPSMLARAAERAGDDGNVRLFQHDMRSLPVLGEFDLVLCLDDSLNHLLEPADLCAALRGIAANLAPDGVAVFDVNTLTALRSFSGTQVVEDEERLVVWRGTGPADLEPGGKTGAQLDVLTKGEHGLFSRATTTLRERHYPVRELSGYLAAAGLELVQTLGQSPGVRLERDVDESRHHKALFVARRRAEVAAPALAA
jgi:SAM-dependent methyltransferase